MKCLCQPFSWREKGSFDLERVPGEGVAGSIGNTAVGNNVVVNSKRQTIKVLKDDNNKNGNANKDLSVPSQNSSKMGSVNYDEKEKPTDFIQSPEESVKNRRKEGVMTSGIDSSQPITELKYKKFDKDTESIALIKKALNANDFIKNLMDDERLNSVVEAMHAQEYEPNSYIIKEGETGSHLYVSAVGEFEVIKGGKTVKTFGIGEAFGELAILYKAKRFASVKASTKAKVWVLERRVFQKIMLRSGKQEQEDNIRFLSCVPILEGIGQADLVKISDFLKREFFLSGTKIVRQGEKGDKFYIIRGGTVAITKRPPDGSPEEFVKELSRGDYFGEQALLHEDRRLATVTAKPPGVECLTLDRVPFNEFLGDIKELKKRPVDTRPSTSFKKAVVLTSEYDHIKLDEIVIIGTLGVGGFGRVELVKYSKDKTKTFALKCLKKVEVVQQQQQEHAYNEKSIMVKCNSPFICKLYKTYKDNKYIYFLMEPLLGGDVWTALQKKRFFNEQTARFMTACVVEAFEYLHNFDIVYRDLKPENLMLDSKGYIKLVDFGYAKFLTPGGKTYTFAGTPEYVAPEIILQNKGHDRSVDCWALGIFIHELLVGKPPFRGTNHMKTYNLILKGIDSIEFNPKISKVGQVLIKKLCRPVPTERLGYLKNGIKDIKNHKWFVGFDWIKLKERKLTAPLIMQVSSNTDLSNFEKYPKDKLPPDETSGWDDDF